VFAFVLPGCRLRRSPSIGISPGRTLKFSLEGIGVIPYRGSGTALRWDGSGTWSPGRQQPPAEDARGLCEFGAPHDPELRRDRLSLGGHRLREGAHDLAQRAADQAGRVARVVMAVEHGPDQAESL
jgi:hypothetical protein